MFVGRSRGGFLRGRNRVSFKSSRSRRPPLAVLTFATSTRIWRNGNRRSNGARRRARARLRMSTARSISPPPTPGPAMIRRRKRPSRNCRRSIPASPCRHGSTHGATIPTFHAQARASSKACAKLGCRRNEASLKAACGSGAMLVACRLAGLSALGATDYANCGRNPT